VKPLVRALQQGALPTAATAIPPEEIEQLAEFWEGFPEPPNQQARSPFLPRPTGLVVRTRVAQDWKARLEQILGETQEFVVDGQKCFRAVGHQPALRCGYTPDDRTLVLTREDLMHELVVDRNASAPPRAWDQALGKVSRGQILLALDSRWLRRRAAQGYSSTPANTTPNLGASLETISPLFDKTRAYAISIGAFPKVSVDVIAETATEADAQPVVETLRALLTLARNSVQAAVHNSDRESKNPAFRSVLPMSDSLLSHAQVDSSGTLVHMQAKSSLELGEALKSLAPVATRAAQSAQAAMSVNHLKRLGLAFHNYHDANGHYPSPVMYGGSRKAIPYSWRVALLPYVEENPLYRQYNFDEPWDGPNNRKLIDKMPAVYSVPGVDGAPLSRSNTSYFVFSGEMAALGGASLPGGKYPEIGVAQILDGTSNTILAVERRADVPWTKPEDIPFDIRGPLPELGGFSPDTFHALFADGSVHTIKKSVNPVTLRALITGAAGEVIDSSSY